MLPTYSLSASASHPGGGGSRDTNCASGGSLERLRQGAAGGGSGAQARVGRRTAAQHMRGEEEGPQEPSAFPSWSQPLHATPTVTTPGAPASPSPSTAARGAPARARSSRRSPALVHVGVHPLDHHGLGHARPDVCLVQRAQRGLSVLTPRHGHHAAPLRRSFAAAAA